LTTQSNRDTTDDARGPLVDFVAEVTGDEFLKVEEDLGEGFVRLNVAEAERRQAKHDIRSVEDIIIELLRNGRDAGAQHLFVASTIVDGVRSLTVIDDGAGVPLDLARRIFEARVTSKLTTISTDEWGIHGRGMALYSIAQNARRAELVASGSDLGAALVVEVSTAELGERADQSSWPKVERDGGGELRVVSGPHNLIRRVVEFALAHPKLRVYLGSPNEILATLIAHGGGRARCVADAGEVLPHCLRPAAAVDAPALAESAADLGLNVGVRSAYRIARGELAPLRDVRSQLLKRAGTTDAGPDIEHDHRGLKFDKQDVAEFSGEVERAFDALAEKYYLSQSAEPKVRLSKNALTIRIPFDKDL